MLSTSKKHAEGRKMRCEICEKDNSEKVGMRCAKYKVCSLCVDELIHRHMIILGRGK